jgi:hypothetical protein
MGTSPLVALIALSQACTRIRTWTRSVGGPPVPLALLPVLGAIWRLVPLVRSVGLTNGLPVESKSSDSAPDAFSMTAHI